jgi:hypothetical protein
VNVASLADSAQACVLLDELATLRSRAAPLADQVMAFAEQRGRLS